MAQSIGVRGVPKGGRGGAVALTVGLTVALALVAGAVAIKAGTSSVKIAPVPRAQVQPATAQWETAARQAGFTGRLGGVAPVVAPQTNAVPKGAWTSTAKAAGFTGRLGATTPAGPPMSTERKWLERVKAGRA
ncbi:MAG TPA: hypothetical protein VGH10_05290 [Actinomycetota bacterium]|jgi:hypothetical protein